MTRWSTKDVIGRIIELYGNDPKLKIISVPDIDPVTGKSNFDYKSNHNICICRNFPKISFSHLFRDEEKWTKDTSCKQCRGK